MFNILREIRHHQTRVARGGATLIELLAVIVIMVILAAAAIPVLAPAMQNRQVREASRIVSGFLTGARNRAMLLGRPVGVVLDRMPGLNEACVSLSYAEVPAPYSGDTTSSVAAVFKGSITYLGSPPLIDPSNSSNTPSTDIGWLGAVRVGDLIRFNYQGPYFQIGQPVNPGATSQSTGVAGFIQTDPAMNASPNAQWPLMLLPGSNASLPANGNYRYQIIRAPVKIAAGSVQLPGTTVIDLDFSGFDVPDNFVMSNGTTHISPWVSAYSFQPIWHWAGVNPSSQPASSCPFGTSYATLSDTSPVMITFAPSGAVDSVWCWANGPQNSAGVTLPPGYFPITAPVKPTTPIHLLVGKRELLPLPTSPPLITDPTDPNFKPYCNWQDLTNFWVSINPQTGLVATVENSFSVISPNLNVSNNNGFGSYANVLQARQLAVQSQRMGGR